MSVSSHSNASQLLKIAVDHHISGRFEEAEALYRELVQLATPSPYALHGLGVLLARREDYAEALPLLKKVLESEPANRQLWLDFVSTLILDSQADVAQEVLRQAHAFGHSGEEFDKLKERADLISKSHPNYVAITKAVFADDQSAQYAHSEALIRQQITEFGSRARLMQALGTVLLKQGRNQEAQAAFETAVKGAVPDPVSLWNQYGIVLNRLKNYAGAEAAYQKALLLRPDSPIVWVNLAKNLNETRRYTEAANWLQKALALNPNLDEAQFNLVISHQGLGCYAQAWALLQSLLNRGYQSPNLPLLYSDLLREKGSLGQAETVLRAALEKPETDASKTAELHRQLQNVLIAGGQHEAAIALLPLALTGTRTLVDISNQLHRCAFDEHSAKQQLTLAKQYGQAVSRSDAYTVWQNRGDLRGLRLGFVSADFYDHPVGRFLLSFLKALRQHGGFELHAYSNRLQADDALTGQLRACFDHWTSIAQAHDETAAAQIYKDEIDILIDLSGHTAGHRLPVFARRPAPVQITWLGYWATTGVPTIDWLLADPIGVSKRHKESFTEKIAYLPNTRLCFTPPDTAPEVSTSPAQTNGYLTFGSFQRLAKLTSAQLRLWGEVLKALPSARLRLQSTGLDEPQFLSSFRQRLDKLGLPLERIELHGPTFHADYLEAYSGVDIVLDTFPFSGGTTTCEALWMGVPTLTLAGKSLLERQGASILSAAGLSGWVTHSPNEYVRKAVQWAGQLEALARLRAGLRAQVAVSPLCDSESFAHAFATTLTDIWHQSVLPASRQSGKALTPQSTTHTPVNDPVAANIQLQAAVRYYEQGRFDAARPILEALLVSFPEQGVVWKVYGVVLTAMGEHKAALAAKRKAVEFSPQDPDAIANLGNSLQEVDELDEAEETCRAALAFEPNHLNALNNLGMVLFRLFRYKEAQKYLEQALGLEPDFPEALVNYANVLRDQKKLEEAEAAYRKAIALEPTRVIAHMNLGVLLGQRDPKRPIEAEAAFKRALELNPNHVETLYNLGSLYRERQQFKRAEDCFAKAVELNPHHALAWVGLGGVKAFANGQVDAAIQCLELGLEKDPNLLFVRSSLLFNHGYTSKTTPQEHLRHARLYGRDVAAKITPFTHWDYPEPSPLRVGLIGGDFRSHPVGYFLENILKYINQSKIELFIYSNNPNDDAITQSIADIVPNWREVRGVSDKKLAKWIHDEKIHILVDLSGHTADGRLQVFPYRAAPVQVTWLGYPSTTGVAAIDWLIADSTGVPPENQSHFTEKICYVPDTRLCFTPPKTDLEVTSLPALENGYVSFGCVQNLTKVTDDVLRLWSKIMQQIPNARLRIQTSQFSSMKVRDDFRARLARQGIDAKRATLLKSVGRAEYLDSLRDSDFLLDSFPYPGGTTTCEALWMGVPTLTLAGNTLLARQGASLMTAGGLADWVANSEDEYVAKAVAFASDTNALATLRAGLREKIRTSPLFDGERFALNLEKAFQEIWDTYPSKGKK